MAIKRKLAHTEGKAKAKMPAEETSAAGGDRNFSFHSSAGPCSPSSCELYDTNISRQHYTYSAKVQAAGLVPSIAGFDLAPGLKRSLLQIPGSLSRRKSGQQTQVSECR